MLVLYHQQNKMILKVEEVRVKQLLTRFQQQKFRHFFYHVLDLNSDHVISQEDFDGLNDRVRHYMDWSVNTLYFLALREVGNFEKSPSLLFLDMQVHSLFLEYFLLTASNFAAPDPFDFCDPFKLAGEEAEEENKASVSIDEWVEVNNKYFQSISKYFQGA